MEERRSSAFIELCRNRNAEFGFLVNRGTTIIEYLARADIESYQAFMSMEELMPRRSPKKWIHEKLEEHFRMLDSQIEALYSHLKPAHFIITADHGSVCHRFRGNLNAWLLEKGFLKKRTRPTALGLARRFRNAIGFKKLTAALSSKVPARLKDQSTAFDWHRSVAFAPPYTLGIFINDGRRFGGPVSERDLSRVIDEICQVFNQTPEATKFNLVAAPYRSQASFQGAKYADKLPDIRINNAEGILPNLVIPATLILSGSH